MYYQGGGVPRHDYDIYFYKDYDSDLSRGRIEICISGLYRTICDEVWDNSDASVACHQLGFSRFGK